MSVASLFGGAFPALNAPEIIGGSSSITNELYGALPPDAQPASKAQLETIRTGTWVSVVRDSTRMTFNNYLKPSEIPTQVPALNEEFPHGAFPPDMQDWFGIGGCNGVHSYVYFNGAVMHRTKFQYSTLMACGPVDQTQAKFADEIFGTTPTIHVKPGQENNEIYLVTGHGAATFKRG